MRNIKHSLIATTATLLLAGCCTPHHEIQWEYKLAVFPGFDGMHPDAPEAFLNDLGKDGWKLVEKDSGGVCIFERVKR